MAAVAPMDMNGSGSSWRRCAQRTRTERRQHLDQLKHNQRRRHASQEIRGSAWDPEHGGEEGAKFIEAIRLPHLPSPRLGVYQDQQRPPRESLLASFKARREILWQEPDPSLVEQPPKAARPPRKSPRAIKALPQLGLPAGEASIDSLGPLKSCPEEDLASTTLDPGSTWADTSYLNTTTLPEEHSQFSIGGPYSSKKLAEDQVSLASMPEPPEPAPEPAVEEEVDAQCHGVPLEHHLKQVSPPSTVYEVSSSGASEAHVNDMKEQVASDVLAVITNDAVDFVASSAQGAAKTRSVRSEGDGVEESAAAVSEAAVAVEDSDQKEMDKQEEQQQILKELAEEIDRAAVFDPPQLAVNEAAESVAPLSPLESDKESPRKVSKREEVCHDSVADGMPSAVQQEAEQIDYSLDDGALAVEADAAALAEVIASEEEPASIAAIDGIEDSDAQDAADVQVGAARTLSKEADSELALEGFSGEEEHEAVQIAVPPADKEPTDVSEESLPFLLAEVLEQDEEMLNLLKLAFPPLDLSFDFLLNFKKDWAEELPDLVVDDMPDEGTESKVAIPRAAEEAETVAEEPEAQASIAPEPRSPPVEVRAGAELDVEPLSASVDHDAQPKLDWQPWEDSSASLALGEQQSTKEVRHVPADRRVVAEDEVPRCARLPSKQERIPSGPDGRLLSSQQERQPDDLFMPAASDMTAAPVR